MKKTIAIVLILANGAVAQLKNHPDGTTMRQWMKDTKCLNLASQPLMNTQFAQLGALDALNDAGVLEKVTGMSGVSSGAFVVSLAATKDFRQNSKIFRERWPGWAHIVPESEGENDDPKLTEFYHERVLNHVLPDSFEELRVPVAITAVAYEDDGAAASIDGKRAQPFVVSDGALAETIVASSSALIGPGCPRCKSGWSAKRLRGHWPVADGFLKDEYGTLALAALDPCPNLLHLQPQNFAQQLSPTKNRNLDNQPLNVVTLGLDVPSSAIMSMVWDRMLGPINKVRKSAFMGSQVLGDMANQDELWEKVQYEAAYEHMLERLDQPMQVDPKDDEQHYFVDLNLKKKWDSIRGWGERKWDLKFDNQHALYWDTTKERRNQMIAERNAKLASGELSFKPCGNGMGSPQCDLLGRRVPSYYKGKKVTEYYHPF